MAGERSTLDLDGRRRVIIESVSPAVDNGDFQVKRVVGEKLVVGADLFADGQDEISAEVEFIADQENQRQIGQMRKKGNDRFEAIIVPKRTGNHVFVVHGWIDIYTTRIAAVRKKLEAGAETGGDLQNIARYVLEAAGRADEPDGSRLRMLASSIENAPTAQEAFDAASGKEYVALVRKFPDRRFETRSREFGVRVDRPRALFSAWYELFPRSCADDTSRHGTFDDCVRKLGEIAAMGFNIVYLPPIHPVGKVNRKGRNNAPQAQPGDPGSPWAIGSGEGGHTSVHPELGTLEDFDGFVREARRVGLDVALDLAFQCSPDHPYITTHPEWFRKLPDGTIRHAENPPKKYEDIVPFDFECEDWKGLWVELKGIVEFWIDKGITIFRADNPHTKPFAFWQWLIGEVRKDHPETLFLSEAFTRPKVMKRLAKIGFDQSYTYFTWRNTGREITDYLLELTTTEMREYFRPNFWPNTPDILPEFIQFGGRPAFVLRLMLAGTLCSNFGIYGPAYELCVREALPDREEYADSEKYEIKSWDWRRPDSLRNLVTRLNRIRGENPALQTTWNIRFLDTDNELLLFYAKTTDDLSNVVFVIANLDPFHTQSGWVQVPHELFGIPPQQTYLVHDLVSGANYVWHGGANYVQLDPFVLPVHLFRVSRRLKRENDFDYYF